MLLRRIFPRSVAAHAGGWDKSADGQPRGARQDARHRRLRQYRHPAFEPGRGDGHAGHLLRSAPTSSATATPNRSTACDDLLAQSDVVSLHVPETPATARHDRRGASSRAMKPGRVPHQQQPRHRGRSRCSGAGAARTVICAGAAVDVFPGRAGLQHGALRDAAAGPRQRHPDAAYRRLHARKRRSASAPRSPASWSNIRDAGSTVGAVNFPQVQLPPRPTGTRFIHVHRNVPGMLRRLNEVFSSRGSTSRPSTCRPMARSAMSWSRPTASRTIARRCWKRSSPRGHDPGPAGLLRRRRGREDGVTLGRPCRPG